jgi:hypothetical protein
MVDGSVRYYPGEPPPSAVVDAGIEALLANRHRCDPSIKLASELQPDEWDDLRSAMADAYRAMFAADTGVKR